MDNAEREVLAEMHTEIDMLRRINEKNNARISLLLSAIEKAESDRDWLGSRRVDQIKESLKKPVVA